MNHRQPYSLPLSQPPADSIRADTCDTRRFPAAPFAAPCPVQPLKGLRENRAHILFYRAFAPAGAGSVHWKQTTTVQHLRGRRWLHTSTTANYSLLTANSLTYTFSAKEKDSETGLSYFGSRYYSSDLSVWLSVDPMSDKYPSLSPYSYCANNPVKLVDPDGEEIVITTSIDDNGNKVVNIKFTATLANKTSQNISAKEMEKYKNEIINNIKQIYSGVKDDGTTVNVDVDIAVLSEGDLYEPSSTRHKINIVDELVDLGHTAESIIGGDFMDIRLDVCRGEYKDDPMGRSAAHEFGHLLGLDHVKESDNIMNPNTKGRVITGSQILESCGYYYNGDINRGIPLLDVSRYLRHQAWKAHKRH